LQQTGGSSNTDCQNTPTQHQHRDVTDKLDASGQIYREEQDK